MSVKNYYPELPEIPYKRTVISMNDVITYGKHALYEPWVLSSAYAIFRNESANGTRGVNNNYAGIQADNARWTNLPGDPIGTCVKIDSGNVSRRFLCFGDDGYKISFELLCIKCRDRRVKNPEDYFTKWVGKTKWTDAEARSFASMLAQGMKLFGISEQHL